MFFLIITILQNVVISAVFKLFSRYNINTLQAIAANYCVCVITGCIFIGHSPFNTAAFHSTWFPWAILMGSVFIPLFYLIAYNTRKEGITTTTVANKLSLVIPVIFSVILYHEQVSFLKITGILLAFPAVYHTAKIKGENNKPHNLFWPAILFIGSGLLDTLINNVQRNFLPTPDVQAVYTVYGFGTAALIGVALVIILLLLKKITFQWKNVIAGIFVGVPNYFSIYYQIRFLNSNFLHSSAAIPVLNIGIVVASTLTAILFFREKVNTLRIIGLVLSISAILFIAFGD